HQEDLGFLAGFESAERDVLVRLTMRPIEGDPGRRGRGLHEKALLNGGTGIGVSRPAGAPLASGRRCGGYSARPGGQTTLIGIASTSWLVVGVKFRRHYAPTCFSRQQNPALARPRARDPRSPESQLHY
ncbi:MAG TPA: hypothetical protein VH702_15220, partial [Vicinamibacterales bacterium]